MLIDDELSSEVFSSLLYCSTHFYYIGVAGCWSGTYTAVLGIIDFKTMLEPAPAEDSDLSL